MREIKAGKYDESRVETLSSLEHIRLRAGMYIGRLGDGSHPQDGVYILLKEVIDNAVDEFVEGYGKKIEVSIADHKVSVRDWGRGIPLGKVVACASHINTGAKYRNDLFQYSVGLNGVGLKAVNALSSHCLVRSHREGYFAEAVFSRGELLAEKEGRAARSADGTYVEFIPDERIFPGYRYISEFLEERLWRYACLNKGLTLSLNRRPFMAKGGLLDLLAKEIGDEEMYPIISYKGEHLEYAFTHTNTYGGGNFPFVNGQYTADGGTHLSAFREGLVKGVNAFYKSNYAAADVREGLFSAVAVRIQEPVFESQTKNKLSNTEIRSWVVDEVRESLVDFLHKNDPLARTLEQRIIANERLRKEISVVRTQAKKAAKRISHTIPGLKDCRYHLTDGVEKGGLSTLFITEGQSATGSMVPCRDVYTQAIFSLRGKPWNTYGRRPTEIYKNEELYNLMMAMGVEDNLSGLRYQNVVIATDADNDGFHIRNLLLTFFLTYFEDLVIGGHVSILETPLFRVRNRKETCYCYSAKERDQAIERLARSEVTRFKGLGEISPQEFGLFIGEKMRLVPVDIKSVKTASQVMRFYMGKNTAERYHYIVENLI